MRLYHATTIDNLASILEHGLRGPSYWTSCEDVLGYYLAIVGEDGPLGVAISTELDDLDRALLEPDRPGIEEPITTALGLSEEEVREAWAAGPGDWRHSLEVVRSLRFRGHIPPASINVHLALGGSIEAPRPMPAPAIADAVSAPIP